LKLGLLIENTHPDITRGGDIAQCRWATGVAVTTVFAVVVTLLTAAVVGNIGGVVAAVQVVGITICLRFLGCNSGVDSALKAHKEQGYNHSVRGY